MSALPAEAMKELLFGGLFGLGAGVMAKKLSMPILAGMSSLTFILLRATIFDARILAPWSPLAIDDPSFTEDLKRKARRETFSESKRMDMFVKENVFVFSGFGGAFILSTMS